MSEPQHWHAGASPSGNDLTERFDDAGHLTLWLKLLRQFKQKSLLTLQVTQFKPSEQIMQSILLCSWLCCFGGWKARAYWIEVFWTPHN